MPTVLKFENAFHTSDLTMSQTFPTLRIGLLWHSMNSDNLGVGALTLAHIAILEQAAARAEVKPQFVVIGWDDRRAAYLQRDDVEVVSLRMKDFVKPSGGLYGVLRGCALVLDIGAGDSFTDIYGIKRFTTLLASKALTLAARRPLILSPQTIGPFQRPWVRRAALAVMRRTSFVASRDNLSTDFLQSMGYDGRLLEATDVALRLPYTPAERPRTDKLRVGINVSGLLFNGGYTKSNMFGLRDSYAEVMRKLLSMLSGRDDVEVHIVPHVISDDFEIEDDHRVGEKLAEEYPAFISAPRFSDPMAAKSYISGMDFFAGARMHACIAALSSGVPVLPMAYSRKFKGLFGTLGYDVLADFQTDDAASILEKFESALNDRAALAEKVQVALANGLGRLDVYDQAVSDVLRAAVGRT